MPMDSVKVLLHSYLATYQIDGKEQKLTEVSVLGMNCSKRLSTRTSAI